MAVTIGFQSPRSGKFVSDKSLMAFGTFGTLKAVSIP